MPVGRYLEYLIKSGNLKDYMEDLINSFNVSVVDNVMCKDMISISL